MKLRIWSVVTALLLLAGLAGCGEELPSAVSSATQAPTEANLTISVLAAPTAVEELRSDRDRSISSVGSADLGELLHRALAGLYMGLVFAPNHKGMPVLDAGMRLDYLRQQVLTSRNIHSIPLMDVAYGGLNRQEVCDRPGTPVLGDPGRGGFAAQLPLSLLSGLGAAG